MTKTKDPSIKDIWSDYLGESSFHGVNKSGEKISYRLRRWIWTLALLSCASYVIFLLVHEIKTYIKFPYLSLYKIENVDSIEFPTVTICNISPQNRSTIDTSEQNRYYSLSTSFWQFAYAMDPINWTDPYYAENGYFEPTNLEKVMNESMDMSKFLLIKIFDLDENQTFVPIVTSAGVCYTWNREGLVTTKLHGSTYNLQILLDINSAEYSFGFDITSGIKVIVHDWRDDPDPLNEGFVAPPGFHALVKLKQTKFNYLPSPYKAFTSGYCIDTESDDFQNPLHPRSYSAAACESQCMAAKIYEQCGCWYNWFSQSINSSQYCSPYQYKECFLGEFERLERNRKAELSDCDCPSPCKQTTYDMEVSYNHFPSQLNADIVAHTYNTTPEYIRNNHILLRMYYDRLQCNIIEQSPQYESIADVFGNIGGQMGLFIGASILTIMELFEVLLILVWNIIKKCPFPRRNISKVNEIPIPSDQEKRDIMN